MVSVLYSADRARHALVGLAPVALTAVGEALAPGVAAVMGGLLVRPVGALLEELAVMRPEHRLFDAVRQIARAISEQAARPGESAYPVDVRFFAWQQDRVRGAAVEADRAADIDLAIFDLGEAYFYGGGCLR